jgi:hypothetical protein
VVCRQLGFGYAGMYFSIIITKFQPFCVPI